MRKLILHTLRKDELEVILQRLKRSNVEYLAVSVTSDSNSKVNLFFGQKECLEVVRSFAAKPLNQLSDHEDFILGILLGYDVTQQCERFSKRTRVSGADLTEPCENEICSIEPYLQVVNS